MNDALRPRSIAELLDHTVELYRRHFVLLFGIPALAIVPVVCLVLLLRGCITVVSILVMSWLMLMAIGAMSHAVVRIYLMEPVTIRDAWKAAFQRWLSLIVSVVLAAAGIGSAVAVGMVFISAVPLSVHNMVELMVNAALAVAMGSGLVSLAVLLLLGPTVVMVENIDGITAMRRSMALVRTNWRRAWSCEVVVLVLFGTVFCIMTAVDNIVFGIVTRFIGPKAWPILLSLSGLWAGMEVLFMVPLQLILTVLLYFDARIRLEGFDIETLAQRFSDAPPSLTGKPESAQ